MAGLFVIVLNMSIGLSVVGGGTGAAYLSGFAKSPLWDLAGGGIISGSSAYAQRSF